MSPSIPPALSAPRVLVDTNILVYFNKRDPIAALYEPYLIGRLAGISFMTRAELERWAAESHWGPARIQRLHDYLRQFAFYGVNLSLCLIWAQVMAEGRSRGRPISVADAWVAATALHFQLPLITHNRKHFEPLQDMTIISESP
ncbi:MAG: PIN domain-containing protein [Armatimonadetes bacterium]|nr:PIN domain-containing protein [Armatimonadota bacterium]